MSTGLAHEACPACVARSQRDADVMVARADHLESRVKELESRPCGGMSFFEVMLVACIVGATVITVMETAKNIEAFGK